MDEQIKRIIFQQPYETKIKIVDKLNAKLDAVPEIEVEISRKLEGNEDIITIISKDINDCIKKAREALMRLKELS